MTNAYKGGFLEDHDILRQGICLIMVGKIKALTRNMLKLDCVCNLLICNSHNDLASLLINKVYHRDICRN